jgi:hypothetical protein
MPYLIKTTAKKPMVLILIMILSLTWLGLSSFFLPHFKVMAQEETETSNTSDISNNSNNGDTETSQQETDNTNTSDEQTSDTSDTSNSSDTETNNPEEINQEPTADETSTSSEEVINPDESNIDQDNQDLLNTENASSTDALNETSPEETSSSTSEIINDEEPDNQATSTTPANPSPAASSGGQITSFSTGSTATGGISNNSTPQILAAWQMNDSQNEDNDYLGSDDETGEGAQFLPSGLFEVDKNIVVCAVATDPDNTQLSAVKGNIYYPADIDWGQLETTGGSCQLPLVEELSLEPISSEQAQELLCHKIKNDNNNLAVFNANAGYESLCQADGELAGQTAQVYCATQPLSYNSPAGNYQIEIFALGQDGETGESLASSFEYLPLTSYEVDFSSVNYGPVGLDIQKVIRGDSSFSDGDGNPTVRNVGNTRLQISITQDDMGLGENNISYAVRIGKSDDDWQDYLPNTSPIHIKNILDLGETQPIEFSVLVTDFPEEATPWSGGMNLFANFVDFSECLP